MRWCYKTVHYELKKEGFLGNAFLDEAEVEKTLNEYGQAGWELVSMMDIQDGLIAIFKQPLDSDPNLVGSAGTDQYMMDGDQLEVDDDEVEELTVDDIIEDDPEDETLHDDELDSIRIE